MSSYQEAKEPKQTVEQLIDELLRSTGFEAPVDPGAIRPPGAEERVASSASSHSSTPSGRMSVATSAAASSRRSLSSKARRQQQHRVMNANGDREEHQADEKEKAEKKQEKEEKKKPSAIEYYLRMMAARELLGNALEKLVGARQREYSLRERALRLGITPADAASEPPAQTSDPELSLTNTNANTNTNTKANSNRKPIRLTQAHVKFLQKVSLTCSIVHFTRFNIL